MHTECYPVSILPKLSRLFLDYVESRQPLTPFYSQTAYSTSLSGTGSTQDSAHAAMLADLLAEQNTAFGAGPAALANIERLRNGARAVVTGQQVALFGGPLFTLLKAATAVRKAKDLGAVPVFWLATEDHDLAEADHVTLDSRRDLHTLRLAHEPSTKPVGNLVLGEEIRPLLDQAAELLGYSPIVDVLQDAYKAAATYSQAFGKLLASVFAGQGLVVIDASTRGFHALGSSVLRYAVEHAAELEAALLERSRLLEECGYHAQVLVTPGSSLLFLVDDETGSRLSLKCKDTGLWTAGKKQYSTEDLLGILEISPERLSPNALLRPVFQDVLFSTAAYVGGPAEIAYFAQTEVLYQAILGRSTPILPRLSATLVEPAIAQVLKQHDLSLTDILGAHPDELAQRLGARSLPIEGKRKLAAAGNALDAELTELTQWMDALNPELGRSAGIAASKMRYQMNRLRRLAANYQLQTEASLRRHVDALFLSLYPSQHPQERVIGAVAFLARYGDTLVPELVEHAAQECPGHKALFL